MVVEENRLAADGGEMTTAQLLLALLGVLIVHGVALIAYVACAPGERSAR